MADQAVDFVMSKINLRVGTRARRSQAPVHYEIPREVVTEAIVNAVAHRDYTSNASPVNPLLAEPLYLTRYIERMGTGTRDMIRRCREAGLPEPQFLQTDGFAAVIRRPVSQHPSLSEVAGEVAGEVTGEVTKLLLVLRGEMSRREVQQALLLKSEENFRRLYLSPALESGLIERTIPDKPKSRLQKYRLTEKGKKFREVNRKN